MVDMTTTELKKMADEAYHCFESNTRDNGDTFYTVKDGSPEWVTDLVWAAHGTDSDGSPSLLPDDYRYQWAMEACEWISEADNPEDSAGEFADSRVDVYTGARLKWLSSNLTRPSYCDEAAAEFGSSDTADIVSMIGYGQYMEAEEVYSLVLNFLNDRTTS